MCTRATLAEVRELQKAAGILNENDIDYSLDEMLDEEEGMVKEKMQSPVTDQWCSERYGRPMTAYSCEHAGGWRTCYTAGAPIDWYCDDRKSKPVPVTYMPHEGYNMNEGVTSTTCPPLPDGTKTMAFITGPGPKDFVCAPVTAKVVGKNGMPLKKGGSPTTPAAAPTAPKPGMQA